MDHSEDLLRSNMKNKFSVELCGDVDLEGMVIIINYEDQPVAEINYENGIDKMEIEIVHSNKDLKRVFLLDNFFRILEEAKQLAIKCAKENGLHIQ